MHRWFAAMGAVLAPVLVIAQIQTSTSVQFLSTQVHPNLWSVYWGQGQMSQTSQVAPDGTSLMQLTVNGSGGVVIQQGLLAMTDLTRYDSFYFFINASATRIGDWTYLVDRYGNRRWFPLTLRSYSGWQQPVYFINKYAGQDSAFDPTHVVSVRFGQSGQMPGDTILAGNAIFANNVVANSSVISTWNQDVGTASFTTTTDTVGNPLIVATVRADAPSIPGQANIAINGLFSGTHWDWSNKKQIVFYFKDSAPTGVIHYFYYGTVCSLTNLAANSSACTCTSNSCMINGAAAGSCDGISCRSYKQYYFDNTLVSGELAKVSSDLQDASAPSVGVVSLTDVNWFEIGILNGQANTTYTWEIGPVRVY